MPSSEKLHHVVLARTEVSEECNASIIRATRIGKLGTTLAVTSRQRANVVPSSPILVTLMMEALRASETSDLTRATQRSIPEDGNLYEISSFQNFVNSSDVCYGSANDMEILQQICQVFIIMPRYAAYQTAGIHCAVTIFLHTSYPTERSL
jgi:hypothetical protein